MERRGQTMPAALAPSLAVVGDGFGAASGGHGEVDMEMVLKPDFILFPERSLEYRRGKMARCAVSRSRASRHRSPQRSSVISG